jgi:acyl-CoA synthetase (NDP forming)
LEEKTSEELCELVRSCKKPLLLHTSFAREPIKSLEILRAGGVPVFESSERAARCLSALIQFGIKQEKWRSAIAPQMRTGERPAVKAILRKAQEEKRPNLLETQSRQLLAEYGVPLPEALLARSSEEAVEAAVELGYPVAMKVVSLDIIHKSEAGGVRLHVKDQKELARAFEEIMANACRVTTKDRVLGALVSPMAPSGQECILGMVQDHQFGPVVMFGLGGIFVEVLKDVAFRVCPLTEEDIDEMIQETKGFKILTGTRGQKPKDIQALKDLLARLSEIAMENPRIEEIDLNPVISHEKGVSIVDSRIILADEPTSK